MQAGKPSASETAWETHAGQLFAKQTKKLSCNNNCDDKETKKTVETAGKPGKHLPAAWYLVGTVTESNRAPYL
jgi:hypothetical protein